MKSVAAIVLGLAVTACSHEFDVVEKVEQQSIDNAQATLGFYIPEDQDWKMSSEATINFTIPGNASEAYTVMVFSNNPLEDGIGYYLKKQTLYGGQNLTTDVVYPAHLKSLFIGITDSNNRTIYKSASVENGQITTLSDISSARTRATGEFANHVGAYPDANMWTSKGFLAPPPLTLSQKLRAQYYFQMNKIVEPYRPDYGTKDFFIQQVYDGGDDPMTEYTTANNPATGEPYSKEVYLAANNSTWITSGEHMDHLTAGPGHLHIFNFNNGNCSQNDNVADRDQTDVNNTAQQHSDKIQLMLNTPTSCFGYANSDASCVRDDRWTLVGAATIDAFCDGDAGFSAWLAARLGNEDDVKCDDEYHRGYIGFDFDMLPDESVWAGDPVDVNGNIIYDLYNHGNEVDHINYHWYELNGKKYHYVSTNTNEFCGVSKTVDPEPTGADALALLNEGWLPAYNTANKTWVKVGGCNDGYFSDWIVTFMPSESGTVPPPTPTPQIWSYAFEDNRVRCDFDMNDVVLRVNINKNDDSKFDVTLVAAGCEYDNYVYLGEDTTPIQWANGSEVHDALGAAKGQMINTGRGVSKTPVTVTIPRNGYNPDSAPFKIWPYKKNGEFGNTADQKETSPIPVTQLEGSGKAPLGIIVPNKWAWPTERTIITEAYSEFVKWATNAVHVEATDWYNHPTNGKVVTIQ